MKLRSLLSLLAFAATAFAADFKNEELAGNYLSLVHETKIETYRFGKNGGVLVQIGQKDGPIAGPAWYWKIETGRLLISDEKGAKQEFELIERGDKSIKVRRRNGEVVTFEVAATKP